MPLGECVQLKEIYQLLHSKTMEEETQCQRVNSTFTGNTLLLVKAQIQKHSLSFGVNKINVELEKNKALAVCKITLCFVMSNYTIRVGVFL